MSRFSNEKEKAETYVSTSVHPTPVIRQLGSNPRSLAGMRKSVEGGVGGGGGGETTAVTLSRAGPENYGRQHAAPR